MGIEIKKETLSYQVKKKVGKYAATNAKDAKITLSFFTVSFVALLVGGILGLFQGLERAGVMMMPAWFDYYQTLTTHGILLILVFTGTFLVGYVYAGISHTLGGLIPITRKLGWTSFGLMVFGTVVAASQVIIGEASVLHILSANGSFTMVLHWTRICRFRHMDSSVWC